MLLGSHEASLDHSAGRGHPESPERLHAAIRGARAAGLGEDLVEFTARAANVGEIERVHTSRYRQALEKLCRDGGGQLDPDTGVVAASYRAAVHGAGAGIDAVARLRDGQASSAFLALRPPGHHACADRAMGFCLFNNVAITAAALLEEGERVMIVDIDAHHGNGTQAAFYGDPRVLYVSLHQYPFYPGSGALAEIGEGQGLGFTINIPLRAGTTGDVYRRGFDEVIVPAAEEFSATWLLVSAGFDAHRDDPLTDLGLTSDDFGDLTERLMHLALPGRRIFFLEGGYNLAALERSVQATVSVLGGVAQESTKSRLSSFRRPAETDDEARRVLKIAAELHERAKHENED